MKKAILIFTVIIGLLSCQREIECRDPDTDLSFIAFSQSTLDTIILRKYTKGGNFQNQIDTSIYSSSNSFFSFRGDTSDLSLRNGQHILKFDFDWQIFLPAINRTILITDIKKIDKTQPCGSFSTHCICDDEVASIKVDNQIGNVQTFTSFNRLYIR
jgi:hypothetical protein